MGPLIVMVEWLLVSASLGWPLLQIQKVKTVSCQMITVYNVLQK